MLYLGTMTEGLRERKKLTTRRALAEAALRLAVDRGYQGFTVADITDAVGVSRRTFSNYFAGRAECLVSLSDDLLHDVLESLPQRTGELGVREILQTALISLGRTMREGAQDYFRLVIAEPELQAAVAASTGAHLQLVAEAISRVTGRPPADIRVQAVAVFALNAGDLCIRAWFDSDRSNDPAALAELLDTAFSVLNLDALTQS